MTQQLLDPNGLPLSYRGLTNYLNVSYGSTYAAGGEAFIAVGKVSKQIQDRMGIKTFMVHLGYFEDVRDAAYTAMIFNDNPDDYADELVSVGQGNFRPKCPTWEHPADVSVNHVPTTVKQKSVKVAKRVRFDAEVFFKQVVEYIRASGLNVKKFIPFREQLIELGKAGYSGIDAVAEVIARG